MHPKRCRIACMSTDLYMHSVYYSMMLLEETNYDSYFLCTPEGTNYDLPYSGKFSLGANFRDFRGQTCFRENKNRKKNALGWKL